MKSVVLFVNIKLKNAPFVRIVTVAFSSPPITENMFACCVLDVTLTVVDVVDVEIVRAHLTPTQSVDTTSTHPVDTGGTTVWFEVMGTVDVCGGISFKGTGICTIVALMSIVSSFATVNWILPDWMVNDNPTWNVYPVIPYTT